MVAHRTDDEEPRKRRAPARTPEALEDRLIALSYKEAEQQVVEGRASSQVLTHFLKAGSTREQLEHDRLRNEVILLQQKVKSLEDATQMISLMQDAMRAFSTYSGQPEDDAENEFGNER